MKTLDDWIARANKSKLEDGQRRKVIYNDRNILLGWEPYCIITDGLKFENVSGSVVVYDTK